jgi:beta-N-acetylhexosaminidase
MARSAPRALFIVIAFVVLSAASCREARAVLDRGAAAARDAEIDAAARSAAAALDDRSLAAQVLMAGVDGVSGLSPASAAALREVPAGAVMLFKYNLGRGEGAARSLASSIEAAVLGSLPAGSPVPPFVAVDHEGGPVHRFGADATRLPAAADFGALGPKAAAAAEGAAYRAARELRALGVTLNLAPLAELSDAESSRFLGPRAYGSDPGTVADAAGAFVAGMARGGVACVVKHFPGNAAADPHKALPVLTADPKRLEELIEPFARVLSSAAPAAVMVSHAVVPSVDPDRPASLSPAVVEGLLRKRLGFRGMIVSDDLRMGAIASTGRTPPRAAVEAVAAGVDLVMTWSGDLVPVRDALVAAVADGRLSRDRLRAAAARVIAEKIRSGVYRPEGGPSIAVPATGDGASVDLKALREETARYLREWGLR